MKKARRRDFSQQTAKPEFQKKKPLLAA